MLRCAATNKTRKNHLASYLMVILISLLAACDNNNRRAATAPDEPPPPPPPETREIAVDLTATQVIGVGADAGSASADFSINLEDNFISGTVTLQGITASAVTLNQGFAGEQGAVLLTLAQDNDTTWSIPTDSAFTEADIESLDAGNIYVRVDSENLPNGALRGQFISGDIKLYFVVLSAVQEVPLVISDGMATAAITLNTATGAIVVHVNSNGLDDATMAHVHRALAGLNGPVLIGLTQDPENPAHWFSEDATLDAEAMEALAGGELYINIHTPAHPPGEVRGQIVVDGVEVVFTRLTGGDVVNAIVAAVATDAKAIAATTIDTAAQTATLHLNTEMLDDASSVTLNQAPVGQNGPVIKTLNQDPELASHWLLENVTFSEGQYTALRNRGLYFSVATPAFPDGELRGQLEPEMSDANPGDGVLRITSVEPANGAELQALPQAIDLTFNRSVLAASFGTDQVELLASGGDGSFDDGNEVNIIVSAVTLLDTLGSVDLSGVMAADDVYRLTVAGSGDDPVTDTAGTVLDGDGDANPGGDFVSTFTVMAAAPQAPTFTFIQENIFTPSCAVSGCHAGPNPAAGQNLSAGQAFNNIVGVASAQSPDLLRIDPGDSANSYMVQKLEGTAAVGGRMPLGGAPLSNDLIQALRQWIDAGAENN